MTNLKTERATAKEMGLFLSEYAVYLFSYGATCIRLEKNVARIAESAGMKAEMSIFPRHIHITVKDFKNDKVFTTIASIKDSPINYSNITQLSKLSWDIADGLTQFNNAHERLTSIISARPYNSWGILLLVSLANAAFCRLFGGDTTAMAIVFLATFAGFQLKQLMASHQIDMRLTVMACAFVSSVLAAADGIFGLGKTPEITIGTSILYLIPGIPYINSFCDMLDRHYICSFSRLMNAIVTTCCLSIGLCAGMALMRVGMF